MLSAISSTENIQRSFPGAATVMNSSDDEGGEKKKGGAKSRRELPAGAVAILKQWLLSPEHFTHPYPTPQDQAMLMEKTGIDKKQLKNWFTNARRRIWKPMLKKQLEMGAGAIPPTVTGAIDITQPSQNSMKTNKPAEKVQNSALQVAQLQSLQQQIGLGVAAAAAQQNNSNTGNSAGHALAGVANPFYQGPASSFSNNAASAMTSNPSLGSLPQMQSGRSNPAQLNKTDSHAVLMELFARDQDLVRRAAEAARLKQASRDSQQFQQPPLQPITGSSQQLFQQNASNKSFNTMQSLTSWPQFNSVSSLTNLGMLSNVKSITNMSGADLAAQGNQAKKANLAHIKSAESMGRNDSYAFLEVFFDDRNGVANNRGTKRDREEDNDIGLSLDADDGPGANDIKPNEVQSASSTNYNVEAAPSLSLNKEQAQDTYTNDEASLKRAYDDALAARGLLSVSRSNEKLTDLALPAKMQRTLSQEFIKQAQASGTTSIPFSFGNPFQCSAASQQVSTQSSPKKQNQQQYPGQNPENQQTPSLTNSAPLADPSMMSASVEVPATTKCAICNEVNVDTQLRPCGHMFHGRCLKPSLQTAVGPPCCPIDQIQMQSVVLAVPVDEPNSGQQWGGNTFRDSATASSTHANENS